MPTYAYRFERRSFRFGPCPCSSSRANAPRRPRRRLSPKETKSQNRKLSVKTLCRIPGRTFHPGPVSPTATTRDPPKSEVQGRSCLLRSREVRGVEGGAGPLRAQPGRTREFQARRPSRRPGECPRLHRGRGQTVSRNGPPPTQACVPDLTAKPRTGAARPPRQEAVPAAEVRASAPRQPGRSTGSMGLWRGCEHSRPGPTSAQPPPHLTATPADTEGHKLLRENVLLFVLITSRIFLIDSKKYLPRLDESIQPTTESVVVFRLEPRTSAIEMGWKERPMGSMLPP